MGGQWKDAGNSKKQETMQWEKRVEAGRKVKTATIFCCTVQFLLGLPFADFFFLLFSDAPMKWLSKVVTIVIAADLLEHFQKVVHYREAASLG